MNLRKERILNCKIASFVPNSLIDWPDQICSIIFLEGCNFRCPYCHNADIVNRKVKGISFDEILSKLIMLKKWVEHVMISGGEPTINRFFLPIVEILKSENFYIGIETNGSCPDVLKELISRKLVDFIAMDIKTSLVQEKYDKACGTTVNLSKISESIDIIKNSKVQNEFRMTVVPTIVTLNDVKTVVERVGNIKIQNFSNKVTLNPEFEKILPYSKDILEEMKKIIHNNNI